MILESRETKNNKVITIVTFEKEQYERAQKSKLDAQNKPIVEWRKCRTNHLVKATKHELLEKSFIIQRTPAAWLVGVNLPVSTTKVVSPNSIPQSEIEQKLIVFIREGNLLGAVKAYKDLAGIGLKEAKDFVDSFYARYNTENKKFKEDFVKESKLHFIKNKSKLETVKMIKDKTGWSLLDAKKFFEDFIA